MLVVDAPDGFAEGCAAGGFGLEGEAHADHFEGVGEEYGDRAGDAAAHEPSEGCLLRFVFDEDGADLLVGEEFDPGVGEDA